MRDWYPLSASGPFSDLKDLLGGLESEWGSFKCGCHPNCGIGTMLLVDEKTKKAVTVPSILDVDRCSADIKVIDGLRRARKTWTALQMGLSVLRNLRPERHSRGPEPWKVAPDHGRPHRRPARLRREEPRLVARASSSAGCGSRTSSTTTSAARRCASSRTRRRWARSPSARTTRAWAGARSSRRCSRPRRWPSGTRRTGRHEVYARGRNVPLPVLPGQTVPLPGLPIPVPAVPQAPAVAARGMLPVFSAAGK